MESIRDLVFTTVQGNSLQVWLTAFSAFLVVFVALTLIRNRLGARLRALALKTENTLDDAAVEAVLKTKWIFIAFLAVWFGSQWLVLSDSITEGLNGGLMFLSIIQAAIWGTIIIGELVKHFVRLQVEGESTQIATTTALTFVGKLVIWSLALLLLLENMNLDVSALVTSLGVGGIAVALAAQNILGDLFASLSIVLDKPFVLGDFIIVDNHMGSVEHIGLKTTRIRSLSGEQLIFSNADLLQSRIRNFKRMAERRVVFALGVTYQTPTEKLEKIPAMIKEMIEAQELTRFDRAHFKDFGNFSLNFELVYWIATPDYNQYMDTQQRINLLIYKQFAEEGIEFAYPTQTLFLEKNPENS